MTAPGKQGGILVRGAAMLVSFLLQLEVPVCAEAEGKSLRLTLESEYAQTLAPGHDTLSLQALLDPEVVTGRDALEVEILLSMLMSPVTLEFPDEAELAAQVRMRRNIVQAARTAQLDFHTGAAERPQDYWTYHEDSGFTLLPGKSLIEALQCALQPGPSGQRYSFSCYRASEYVILLGMAQEIRQTNPSLYEALQRQWERKAIQSGRFHGTFLREIGSLEQPLPLGYYVPGDRVWFRNPDAHSSDVAGYEGSWVIYLGGGLFNHFWNCAQPYTLADKCVEIYHWRNAVERDAAGEPYINENKVAALVQRSRQHPDEWADILSLMMRLREPSGIYHNGGCIDATREHPRRVCAGSSDIELPS